ncbi:MAG: protein kinase [Phycisphaera sp.]|nr:protein kinase [Phycisphaera sp.]
MTTPPPISQEELDALARRIDSADAGGRSEMIEAAAGGDLALADEIDRWLRANEASSDDLHEQGTIVDDGAGDEDFRSDLAATLVDDAEPEPSKTSGSGSVRGEETTLIDPAGEEMTLAEPAAPSGGGDSSSGSADAGSSSGTTGSGGSGFSSRPQTIEGFQVEKLLGAGGMGSVYLCKQSSPEREVAVKLMLPGLANARAVQRFEFEIETLAKLSHPNVAKLYEAGLHDTDKGPTPYVAMEMVRGARTIIEYADEEQLDFDARIRLFIRGCRGVAFGHGRGVIHRDLKPPNLLVDERGEPKVIDFGVALAADDEAGRRELVGTLQYMAPEQASRGEVGTATDVFAMGMILFELLAGGPPYMVPGDSLAKALDKITTVEIPRLSTRIEKVPRDIDAIVTKAMASDPENRYATAGDLAADLQRYLDDEPTIARAPTFKESFLRLVRKHRIETGFAAAAVVALVVGVIVTAIFAYRAEGARITAIQAEGETRSALEQVEAQQERTERSLALFLSVLGNLEPSKIGATMLDAMVDGLDREYTRRGTDEDEVIDAIIRQRELAKVFSPTDVAVRVVEKHLEAPTLRMLPLIEDDRRTLANLNEFLGEMLAGIGRLDDASAYYGVALGEWSAIESRSGENRRRAGGNLADTLLQQGRVDDAIENLDALVIDGRGADGRLDLTGLRHLNALAVALAGNEDYESAQGRFEDALEGYKSLIDEGRAVGGDLAGEIVQIRLNLGSAKLALGELDEAETILRLTNEELQELEDVGESLVQVRLNLGRVAFQQSRFEVAQAEFNRAVEIAVDQFGRSYLLTSEAMYELGKFRFQIGDYPGAIPLLENSWEVRIKQLGRESSPALLSGLFLTLSYAAGGDLPSSQSLLDVVDGDFLAARDVADPDRMTMLYFFANFANSIGGVDAERAATVSLERLHDACVESSDLESEEVDPRQMCADAKKLLAKFYDAMIESEPDADWAVRRDIRFGS